MGFTDAPADHTNDGHLPGITGKCCALCAQGGGALLDFLIPRVSGRFSFLLELSVHYKRALIKNWVLFNDTVKD